MDKNKYFLGSVGRVEAFRMANNPISGKNEMILAFVSKTMTDTGLNTSVSADDIRGGQGAPIITRFYHDTNVEITLTDVMFKKDYVEAQLGTEFVEAGEAYFSETLDAVKDAEGGKYHLELSKQPIKIGFGCEEPETPVWYTKEGQEDWRLVTVEGQEIKGLAEDGKYCVRYLAEGIEGASRADIYAGFVPQELHLVITTPLFAGDACSASGGTIAGEVQYDIPRFRLNGGQDFAAAMSSNQTTNLSGVALGSTSGCDNEQGALLYSMIVKLNNAKLDDMYKSLAFDPDCLVKGGKPLVFGIDSSGKATLIGYNLLEFSGEGWDAKEEEFKAAGSVTAKVKGGTLSVTETIAEE